MVRVNSGRGGGYESGGINDWQSGVISIQNSPRVKMKNLSFGTVADFDHIITIRVFVDKYPAATFVRRIVDPLSA